MAGTTTTAGSAPIEGVQRILASDTALPVFRPVADSAVLAGIDNSVWRGGIDPTQISNIRRPVLTIVVGQDPPAGTQVPFGTPVNLILSTLDSIPISVLKNPAGLSFTTVGALQSALVAANLQTAVSSAPSFDALSAADKQAVTNFATTHGGAAPAQAFDALKVVASL
ncbi:MAG TPA: PASTA domain-containing protein [Actinomycetota bacterium]|nr:PASTA domain-containing protein [Actinomycetota bacterium]